MTSADVVPPVMSIREGLEPARRLTYVAPSGTMLMNAQPHPQNGSVYQAEWPTPLRLKPWRT